MIQYIRLVSVTCDRRQAGARDRVDSVGPSGVLDRRDVGWVPLVVDVLSGLCAQECCERGRSDRCGQYNHENDYSLDPCHLEVEYSLSSSYSGEKGEAY